MTWSSSGTWSRGREVPGYLALADAYVQPGAPDEFNRYRLPSKLPEFLSMGRPVILPACNLGNELVDGEEALLLREGSALEIAARIENLLDAPERRPPPWRPGARVRARAPELAPQCRRARGFLSERARGRPGGRAGMTAGRQTEELVPDERLWELKQLYGEFEVPPVSYGTVRDFADSLDNLGGLARANSDMKDLQRCWAVKAVLGSVGLGGRLVEIGAGEPLAADTLARLGYEVTVIDPYDGSDRGPESSRSSAPPTRASSSCAIAFRPSAASGSRRRGVLDLRPGTHPHRFGRAGGQRDAREPAARRLCDPRHRPRRRGLGAEGRLGGAWRRSRGARASLSSDSMKPSARSSRTLRPTGSRPRHTSAGAAGFPTSTIRCAASPR